MTGNYLLRTGLRINRNGLSHKENHCEHRLSHKPQPLGGILRGMRQLAPMVWVAGRSEGQSA